MTKELHLKLVEAFWDGKLEFCREGDWWVKSECGPAAHSDPSVWRIRPTPKLRPWTAEEVPVGSVVKYKHNTSGSSRGIILHTNGLMVWTSFDPVIAKEFSFLLDQMVYSVDSGFTWLPCGVEEVEK